MTKSRFEKISDFFNSHERLFFLLRIIYNYLPLAVMVSYPALLIYLFVSGNKADFIKALVVPAVTFAAATLFRAVINSQRPYEKLGIKPLIQKNTVGKSFPSRHSASVFIIAMAFLHTNVYLGAAMFAVGFLIILSRVLAGVHYEKDVLAGLCFSVLLGIFGFYSI